MEKFLRGFAYAFKGLKYAFCTQVNFKVHSVVAILVVIAGVYFQLSFYEWLWISLAIAMVLIIELLNTAIEVFVDLVSPNFHSKAGIIKDVSAAAVLISALLAVIIGAVIFIPKII